MVFRNGIADKPLGNIFRVAFNCLTPFLRGSALSVLYEEQSLSEKIGWMMTKL